MALFGSAKPSSYLGVDIGAGGIKLVELANDKGRAKLLTYAYSEREPDEMGKLLLDDPKAAAAILISMIKKAGVVSTKAISGLPQHTVFDAVISIPRTKDEKQIKALVEAQIRKLTPIPFEEMIIDSKMIDPEKMEKSKKNKNEKKKQEPKEGGKKKKREYERVLVTGAAKTLVQKYIEIFKLAKLELVSLETEAFALIRSLVGHDRSVILLLDIGAVRTNITIVENGIPFLTKSVSLGGAKITKQIANQMGITAEEAEQMKLDLGRDKTQGVPPIVELALQPILNEMNYSIGEFRRQEESDGSVIEKIILTGGSSSLPGVANYLSEKMNVSTYIGDPWARVARPEALRPVLDEIGSRFAVAVGLAMRDIE